MATVQQLRAQAKVRKIPKYSSMNKAALMSALGQSASPAQEKSVRQVKQQAYNKQQGLKKRARSTANKSGIARTYAADKLGGKLGGGDADKKEAIKKRIVKAVSKGLKAEEKAIGRKLTVDEKRKVAIKALSSEVRAIKSGKTESENVAKAVSYRDRALAKKNAEAEVKAPKSGIAPFQRRKGGALAVRGGQLERSTPESEPKGKKGKKERPSANPRPQDAIDQKYGSAAPSDADVQNWKKETAIANSDPSDANVHRSTLKQMQNLHSVKANSRESWAKAVYAKEQKNKSGKGERSAADFDTSSAQHQSNLDAARKRLANPKTSEQGKEKAKKDVEQLTKKVAESKKSAAEAADRYNEKLGKPKKERIAELHEFYDANFKTEKEAKTKLHEKVKAGNAEAISRAIGDTTISPDGKTQRAFKAHQYLESISEDEAVKQHLSQSFARNGGDSKTLGLQPGKDFTVGELKAAYRSASLKAHPDRGGSPEKFQALKESYDRMLPKAKSPALDKVAAETGMTREEVAKAVKRRKARG